jgi:uncharacterized repeat protein (TIGR01451 family)
LITATATDPVGNTSPFSGGVAASGTADVSVSIQSSPAQVQVGQNLTYTLTVINNGPTSARGVVVTDTLPAGVTYVSSTSTQGSAPTQASGVVTAAIGTMAANSTATVTIVVKTTISAAPSVTDTASVVSQETDPNPANNTATITSAVTAVADLSVSLNGDKSPVLVGQSLTYAVKVTNKGPSPATGVKMTDVLPAAVTFVSASADVGSQPTESAGTVTDAIDDLAAGASVNVTIVVTATPSAPPIHHRFRQRLGQRERSGPLEQRRDRQHGGHSGRPGSTTRTLQSVPPAVMKSVLKSSPPKAQLVHSSRGMGIIVRSRPSGEKT